MFERLKKTIERQMYLKSWWYYIMWLPSKIYGSIVYFRKIFFQLGLFKTYHFPVPVVVVGNVTVGGNGKTPMVAHLVRLLINKGYKPGVVSRGYGATTQTYPHSVTPGATDAGDEAVLHAQLGVPVVIDPNRVRAVGFMLSQTDVDVIISDDGLQHDAMGRDVEIIMHAEGRVGNGAFMPAGPIREPLSRMDFADFIVEKGGKKGHYIRLAPEKLRSLDDKQERELDDISQCYLVTAIADPSDFRQHFPNVKGERFFLDHHHFQMKDFTGLEDAAIVMTEKDAVKCRHLPLRNAWYLKTQVIVNKSFDTQFLNVLKYVIKHKARSGVFKKVFSTS